MNQCDERVGLLAECLETVNQSLIELTAVFRVKRRVLAAADLEALADLLEREENVAEVLFDAESRREVLAEEIATATGAESLRLVDIAAALPEGAGEVLLDAGARVKTTMELLVREARIVATICSAAVDHYEKLIRIISGAELEPAVYNSSGRKGQSARRNIVDQAY
jgi:hypothetical protein